MKGVSFQSGVEFKVHIEGESWSQGDSITGSIEVKNHSFAAGALPSENMRLGLAYALDRKVKAKDPESFADIEMAELTGLTGKIGAGTSLSSNFKFQLPLNARVTDKSSAIYLVYGLEQTKPLANLRLNILPHQHLLDVTDVVATTFRFVNKGIKSTKKGEAKVTLAPPTARELSMIDELELILLMNETQLEIDYVFTLKQVDAMAPGLKTKKVDHAFNQVFELSELLHSFNSRVNREVVERSFQGVLTEVKAVPLG
jgi:hypothetical protein